MSLVYFYHCLACQNQGYFDGVHVVSLGIFSDPANAKEAFEALSNKEEKQWNDKSEETKRTHAKPNPYYFDSDKMSYLLVSSDQGPVYVRVEAKDIMKPSDVCDHEKV